MESRSALFCRRSPYWMMSSNATVMALSSLDESWFYGWTRIVLEDMSFLLIVKLEE